MRVIITGGTGMIGRALSRDLVRDGHEVIILSRNPQKHRQNVVDKAKLIEWDAKSAHGWLEYADGASGIINLAGVNIGESRWTEKRKKAILSSRIDAGKAVVEAINLAKNKPAWVIQASAVGYYGASGDQILTEESPAGNEFQSFVCQEWERSTEPLDEMGIRRVVIRSGLVLDRFDGALPRMAMPFRLFVGGRLGNGEQWFSWIHLNDEVQAIRFLIDRTELKGVFNLTAPNPVRNREFASALGKVLRRPSLIPVPAFALKIMFGEMARVLLTGQRVVPERLLAAGYKFQFPEIISALKDIYKQIPSP